MIYYLSHSFTWGSIQLLTQIQQGIIELFSLIPTLDSIEKKTVTNFHITVMYSKGKFGNYCSQNSKECYSKVEVSELDFFDDEKENSFHIIAKLNAPKQVALHHQLMRDSTATYDFAEYVPHCTLLTVLNVTDTQKNQLKTVIKIFNEAQKIIAQPIELYTESESFCIFREKISTVTDEQLQSMIEHLTAMTTGSRAEDGLGKFLGDGLPRKDKDGNDYVLRTGLLALALTELQKLRK